MVPPELPVPASYDLDAIERAARAAQAASAQSRVSLDAATVLALVRDLRAAREQVELARDAIVALEVIHASDLEKPIPDISPNLRATIRRAVKATRDYAKDLCAKRAAATQEAKP